MPNTVYTKKLEQKRNSAEVQAFKVKVLAFLDNVNASPEIRYRLMCDLSKKIDMPFYGVTKKKVSASLSCEDVAKKYIELLIQYNDLGFAEELFSWLTKQQSQTLRRIHKCSKYQKQRKSKYKTGVFEHPVPVNHSRKYLLKCIKEQDSTEASLYIDYMSRQVPQIFLTKEEDARVNQHYRDSMPAGWNWKKDSPFIRYEIAEISSSVYIEK